MDTTTTGGDGGVGDAGKVGEAVFDGRSGGRVDSEERGRGDVQAG